MPLAAASVARLKKSFRGAAGIARSLRIYYGDRARRRLMAALYSRFVKPGDLVFDIGAHVGDRVSAFRSLGARVVAIEPQPAPYRWLRLRYGRDRMVSLVQAAIGDEAGEAMFHVNLANPTISTASKDFIDAASGASGWEGQCWDETISVPVVTLDMLIEQYGVPAFAKIDVEGYELNVLKGLSEPVPALSFEFTTIQRDVAVACIERVAQLGPYNFNAAIGESQQLLFQKDVSAATMRTHLLKLPHEVNSGDIYARL
ncbi:MAG: FkbM family methyltransferase [Hyphomicrobiales bacterium]|nr:FkbM family methyltransferase [Hyphomicrobiales bacterium]